MQKLLACQYLMSPCQLVLAQALKAEMQGYLTHLHLPPLPLESAAPRDGIYGACPIGEAGLQGLRQVCLWATSKW